MEIDKKKLFFASRIALIATAMTFAIRADLLGNTFGEVFKLSNEDIGWCMGTAFWGFTLAMIFGGFMGGWYVKSLLKEEGMHFSKMEIEKYKFLIKSV